MMENFEETKECKPLVVEIYETPLNVNVVSSELTQETLFLTISTLFVECAKEGNGLMTSKKIVE